jgi:hypothetical protein
MDGREVDGDVHPRADAGFALASRSRPPGLPILVVDYQLAQQFLGNGHIFLLEGGEIFDPRNDHLHNDFYILKSCQVLLLTDLLDFDFPWNGD